MYSPELTAFESAVEVRSETDRALESAAEAFVVAVLIRTLWETFLESVLVCRVEMTTESETALLSAVLAFAVAVEISVDWLVFLLSTTDRLVESTVELETVLLSATLAANPALAALESAVLALEESVTANEPAETALESAIDACALALSAALIAKLSTFREFVPVEICALTALCTVEPAVTRETAAEAPEVYSPALRALLSAVEALAVAVEIRTLWERLSDDSAVATLVAID